MKPVDMKIKEFYVENYPSDDLGVEISDSVTFDGLNECLSNDENVYDYIGVGDSLIRERCFEKLSEILNCSYDEVYDKWLMNLK
jgi:hypothetical protein